MRKTANEPGDHKAAHKAAVSASETGTPFQETDFGRRRRRWFVDLLRTIGRFFASPLATITGRWRDNDRLRDRPPARRGGPPAA